LIAQQGAGDVHRNLAGQIRPILPGSFYITRELTRIL